MEQSCPPSSTFSQRASSTNVRQPVSCEPCRNRKIKCSRTRPVCDTCRRRGCAHRCVYKGYRDEDEDHLYSPSNDELLKRINNLERLLRQQTSGSASNFGTISEGQLNNATRSSPDAGQEFHPSPESLVSESSPRSVITPAQPSSARYGILTLTSDGNVRYEPRTSQWSSVLANTTLSVATPEFHDQDGTAMSCGFPFSASPISSLDEILQILPPMQQCNYLKDQYFRVFSPVRIFSFSIF